MISQDDEWWPLACAIAYAIDPRWSVDSRFRDVKTTYDLLVTAAMQKIVLAAASIKRKSATKDETTKVDLAKINDRADLNQVAVDDAWGRIRDFASAGKARLRGTPYRLSREPWSKYGATYGFELAGDPAEIHSADVTSLVVRQIDDQEGLGPEGDNDVAERYWCRVMVNRADLMKCFAPAAETRTETVSAEASGADAAVPDADMSSNATSNTPATRQANAGFWKLYPEGWPLDKTVGQVQDAIRDHLKRPNLDAKIMRAAGIDKEMSPPRLL